MLLAVLNFTVRSLLSWQYHPMHAGSQSVDDSVPETPGADRGVTVLDAWRKARRQLARGLSLREVVAREFEDIYPGQIEKARYNPPACCQRCE